jgi:ubiquinone/menaquinone biosynthesis C-methylase UbiE
MPPCAVGRVRAIYPNKMMNHSISRSFGAHRLGRGPRPLVPTIYLAFALLAFGAVPVQAQLGARPAEAWIKTLESSNRVEKLKVDETVAKLNLKPGDRIADVGAGSGIFCPSLAKAVTPGGKVYAVDIEQGLIDHIANRARELKLTNIEPVLGRFTDPNLPVRDLDLAFMYDVLHHIEHREEYLRNLAKYLKSDGRIAVIDFHPPLGPHPNDPELQVTRDEADAWMSAIGFEPTNEIALFDDKWFVVYSRSGR